MTVPGAVGVGDGDAGARPGWARGMARSLLPFAPQIALAPILFFAGVTFLHEAAHAAVVLAFGGTLREFSFLPGPQHLGHVRYDPPPGAPFWFAPLVSVAPYLMWSALAGATALAALLRAPVNASMGAALFFW